jgi:ferredoxin-thioredoxin reductase catalytic subunit
MTCVICGKRVAAKMRDLADLPDEGMRERAATYLAARDEAIDAGRALLAALAKYGAHWESCKVNEYENEKARARVYACTCGYHDAIAALGLDRTFRPLRTGGPAVDPSASPADHSATKRDDD